MSADFNAIRTSDEYLLPTTAKPDVTLSSRYSEANFNIQLPKVRYPMRLKLTLPYIILALMFAGAGAFVISQILVDTLEERFINQLLEAGKLSADRMVVEETQRLKTLRLIANTTGVSDSIRQKDAEQLRKLVWPLAANAQEEAVDILDLSGISILSMRHQAGESIQNYTFSSGDTTFKSLPYIQNVLEERSEENQDKYPGLVMFPKQAYFYVAGPIVDEQGNLVGVVQVGRSLDTLVEEFRAETLAHITLYASNGDMLATTLPLLPDQALSLDSLIRATVNDQQRNAGITHDFPLASIHYTELVGNWQARQNTQLGYLSTTLPQSFLARTSELTRVQVFALVLAGLVIVIIIGVYLSRRITRPLLEVVHASAKAAQGDLDVNVKPVGDDEIAVLAHAFNRMMVGLKDATEQRLQQIELLKELEHERDLRELKSRFISMVSHEFKTPLTTILSSSELVRTYGNSLAEEKKQKHFNRIQSSVSVMKQLIEDVLIIGKTEAHKLQFSPVAVDLKQFSNEILDEIRSLLSEKHALQFHYSAHISNLNVDPKLLRSALVNLLTNAIKYSPDGGNIHFIVNSDRETVVFKVKDEGIGIPDRDQKRIFETFHRAQNVGNLSGTGLGLYITKMAVELHQGTIRFQSRENLGTTFVVSIPITKTIEFSEATNHG